MANLRRYLTQERYTDLTGKTITNQDEWNRQVAIVEAIIDDVVGLQERFHHRSKVIKLSSIISNTFTSPDLQDDRDDFYKGLTIRTVQGPDRGLLCFITAYNGTTKVATIEQIAPPQVPDVNSTTLLEQVGIFPRAVDYDGDGRPHNPEALERAVAAAFDFMDSQGGVNSTVWNISPGKNRERIGQYEVQFDTKSQNDLITQIGTRAYGILSNSGLISSSALLVL